MRECTNCKSLNIKKIGDFEYFDVFECINCESIFSSKISDCCRQPYSVVVVESSVNGKPPKIFDQCLKCGGADRSKCHSKKTHSELIRYEFDSARFSERATIKQNEIDIIQGQFKNFRRSKYYKYHLYLKSPEWKIIRDQVMLRDNGTCVRCKSRAAEEIHHKHYDTIYKETLDDLESVCSNCHRDIHKSVFSLV